MSSRLHRKPGYPYYIYALDYRETSSGICALHYLCHALNLEGFEAYVAGTTVLNGQLKTPLLTEEVVKLHAAQQRTPIAVYPEVITGNPLSAKAVVRYMLNREGIINGNLMDASEDDLLFYYSSAFTPSASGDFDLLTVPMLDTDVFSIHSDQKPGTRSLLYLNRIPHSAVDLSRFSGDLEVLSMASPLPLPKLAETLRQAKVLYTFELSSTCMAAMLCGCPVVMLDLPGYEHLGFSEKNLAILEGNGYARRDDPLEIQQARDTLPQVKRVYQRIEDSFWQQLAVFGHKTQAHAQTRVPAPRSLVHRWLGERILTPVQSALIEKHLEGTVPLLLGVLVEARGRSTEQLKLTLTSLRAAASTGKIELHLAVLADSATANMADECALLEIASDAAAATINAYVQSADFDWLICVEAGSEFTANGLLVAALRLRGVPDSCLAVYADEAMRLSDGGYGLSLRPDLNLDLLLSFPASLSTHWLLRREALLRQAGFSTEAGQAFELDYQLRLIESYGLGCVVHISEPLLVTDAFRLQDSPEERDAIERHLQRRGYAQAQIGSSLPGRYELDYGQNESGLVSILVVVSGRLLQAQRCVETLLENTLYSHYEVLLLDYGNTAPEVKTWLAGVEAMGVPQLRVLRHVAEQSITAVRNQAAQQAHGEFLLWLGDGAAIMSKDWLHQLLNHSSRPEVGCVGAKLLSSDGHIRHAGLVLGLHGPAGRAFEGAGLSEAGYMQRLQVDQNYSALSGECLMLRREVFQKIGGFEASPLLAPWADVDLCLRLQQVGYLNVWTPRAQLLSDAKAEVQPSVAQEDAMYARWLPMLARDPAYNANLSLQGGQGFELLDAHMAWRPLQSLPSVPTVLAHQADLFGCGHYRVIQPLAAMREAGLIDGVTSLGLLHPTDIERFAPDTIVLQRQVGEERLEAMRRMQAFSSAFKVYELDDYLPNIPLKSVHRQHMPKDILRTLRRGLGYVDRFVVSTSVLAEAFAGLHDDIRVIENRLPIRWWEGLSGARMVGTKPRVGWAGGSSHRGDLELIADVVQELMGEVEWVFFGMCPDKLKPYIHEFHEGVSIEHYPAALARLNLDLALAPVEQNLFNECKSNLRLLEYGACGFPVICSDVRCYQGDDLPVTRVKNRFKDWVEAIRMHLADLDATARIGDELQFAVRRDWMLKGEKLEAWRKVWLPD